MGIIASESSSIESTTLLVVDWWIKDPDDETNNLLIHVDGGNEGLKRKETQQSNVYNPIGRKFPVIVTDAIQGIREEIDVVFSDEEEDYEQLRTLFGLQKVLLLQSGWLNDQWYVRFHDDWEEFIDNTDPPYRIVTLKYIEQDYPS